MDPREEEIVRLICDPTLRAILSVLDDAAREFTVSEIAEQVVAREADAVRPTDLGDERERMVLALHHFHLPRLAEAEVIHYDADANVASFREGSTADVRWGALSDLDDLWSRLDVEAGVHENDIGVIETKEAVYEYARELADRAEEELFLVYTSDELIDERCLPNAEDAIDRGVEFYAGAKSRSARTFFRERLPEATIWEPQADWTNGTSGYPKLSRLVFADRDKVVVGLWIESATDGTKTEVAMIGEGSNNPLVVLVRELLGPRLDHLDFQSEDFLGDLPFET